MTALPQISKFIDSKITEGDFKVALSELRDYLNGLLGEDGTTATAGRKLNMPLSDVIEKTENYSAVSADRGKVFRFTGSAGLFLSLDAALALGNGWNVTVINDTSSVVTIVPYTGEVIDGTATYVIKAGGRAGIVCDGTRIYTTVPAVPDSVGYATNANYANSSGYADSAGSVAGIGNPMSRDVGAGGIGAIVFGYPNNDGTKDPGATAATMTVCTFHVASSSLSLRTSQEYGGTWRNIGSTAGLYSYGMTMWQRIA